MSEYEMLRGLLRNFYTTTEGELEWMWTDGVTVADRDEQLNESLMLFLAKIETSGESL